MSERKGALRVAVALAVLVAALAPVAASSPGSVVGNGDVTWVPACRGGIEGQATDDRGRKVSFRVCALPGGGFDSRILDREGRELTRVEKTGEGEVVVRIGGVAIGEANPGPDALAEMERVLDSPDAPLAGRLPLLLADDGLEEDSLAVRALAAHGPVWERGNEHGGGGMHPRGAGCLSPGTGCLGCCGPGCVGCTGICTPECLAHDECVERLGHLHPRCLELLQIAILSTLECLDCDSHCTDGPADCCKGEGPACLEIP